MNSSYIATRTGLRAWFTRLWAGVCIDLKLRWAEQDREFLAHQAGQLPERLQLLDQDIAVLRVQRALLRSGR